MFGGGSCSGHACALALVENLGGETGALVGDSVEGHLHSLSIGLERSLDLCTEIAVHLIPIVRFLRQFVLIPTWNVALDELDPQLFVVFSELGGCEFEGMLRDKESVSKHCAQEPGGV